jgi:glycerophosphoryl diester phosphodiesterase
MSTPKPAIIHHMAALDAQFPPNSLDAIRACLEANADVIEVDIMALASEDYLLVHDAMLHYETSGEGRVDQLLPEDARRLTYLGKDQQPSLYPVALLSDVVNLLLEFGGSTRLQLDFKHVYPFATPEPLERLIRLITPLGERVIVSSIADWQLRKMRKLAPALDLGFDIQAYLAVRADGVSPSRFPPFRRGMYGYWDDHPLAAEHYQPITDYLTERCATLVTQVPRLSTFFIDHRLVAKALDDGFNWAEALHSYDIRLGVWTVDSHVPQMAALAKRLQAAGVDYITTNTPQAMKKLLHGGGAE